MQLHQRLLKQATRGFTLAELLIALSIGGFISWAATDAVITHIKTNETLDTAGRLREDWSRTSHFIESEVALSERVLTDFDTSSSSHCDNSISSDEFRFALDLRRDIKQVIYYVKTNSSADANNWVGDSSLWRCGPNINEDGSYISSIVDQRIIDGLTTASGGSCNGGNSPDPYGLEVLSSTSNSARKSLSFSLCVKRASQAEIANSKGFSMQTGAYSRVTPIYSYPNNNILCSEQNLTIEGFYKLDNDRVSGNVLAVPLGAIDDDQPVLICGDGREILGSFSDDVLEGGLSEATSTAGSIIQGNCGNDRLLGTKNDDTLYGDFSPNNTSGTECNTAFTATDGSTKEYTTDSDTLIGNDGDDTLYGGDGTNYFLPGNGNNIISDDGTDTIYGGTQLDVVFMDGPSSAYSGQNSCSTTSCTLTSSAQEKTTMKDVEVVIFADGRLDLPEN